MGKLRFEIYDGQLIRIDENDCEVIHIPEGIQSVENYAFDRCKNLKEVYFPASVMKICHGIFENFKLLKKIEVSPDNPYFDSKPLNGVLYEKNGFMVVLLTNKDGETLDIHEGAERIAVDYESLNDIQGLSRAMMHYNRIIIPSTLKQVLPPGIMDNAKNVKEISVHEKNEYFASVDGVLFTKNLKMLIKYPKAREGAYHIPDTTTAISKTAFRYCKKLTELYVPGALKWFRSSVSYCSVTAIHFEEGVKTIEGYNFTNCDNLTEITFPASVNLINGGCFLSCQKLKSITFLSKQLYFAAEPTEDGVLNRKKHPLYLPVISSFTECDKLESVSFPNLEEGYIPLDFLKFCPSLKYLRIGKYEIHSANGMDADGLVYNTDIDIPFIELCFISSIITKKNYRSAEKVKPNIILSVIAATDFINDGEKNAEKYIKDHTVEVFDRLIFSENTTLIRKLLNSGKFVSDENIEEIAKRAIDHTQNGGNTEAQVLLSQYANKLHSGLFSELEI